VANFRFMLQRYTVTGFNYHQGFWQPCKVIEFDSVRQITRQLKRKVSKEHTSYRLVSPQNGATHLRIMYNKDGTLYIKPSMAFDSEYKKEYKTLWERQQSKAKVPTLSKIDEDKYPHGNYWQGYI